MSVDLVRTVDKDGDGYKSSFAFRITLNQYDMELCDPGDCSFSVASTDGTSVGTPVETKTKKVEGGYLVYVEHTAEEPKQQEYWVILNGRFDETIINKGTKRVKVEPPRLDSTTEEPKEQEEPEVEGIERVELVKTTDADGDGYYSSFDLLVTANPYAGAECKPENCKGPVFMGNINGLGIYDDLRIESGAGGAELVQKSPVRQYRLPLESVEWSELWHRGMASVTLTMKEAPNSDRFPGVIPAEPPRQDLASCPTEQHTELLRDEGEIVRQEPGENRMLITAAPANTERRLATGVESVTLTLEQQFEGEKFGSVGDSIFDDRKLGVIPIRGATRAGEEPCPIVPWFELEGTMLVAKLPSAPSTGASDRTPVMGVVTHVPGEFEELSDSLSVSSTVRFRVGPDAFRSANSLPRELQVAAYDYDSAQWRTLSTEVVRETEAGGVVLAAQPDEIGGLSRFVVTAPDVSVLEVDTNDPPDVEGRATPTPVRSGETLTLEVTSAEDPDGDEMTFEWEPSRVAPDSYDTGQGRTVEMTAHDVEAEDTITYYVYATDSEEDYDRYAVQFTVKPSKDDTSGNATNATTGPTSGNATTNATTGPTSGNATNATTDGVQNGGESGEQESGGDDTGMTESEFESEYENLEWSVWADLVS